jgi:hypothetical protein
MIHHGSASKGVSSSMLITGVQGYFFYHCRLAEKEAFYQCQNGC